VKYRPVLIAMVFRNRYGAAPSGVLVRRSVTEVRTSTTEHGGFTPERRPSVTERRTNRALVRTINMERLFEDPEGVFKEFSMAHKEDHVPRNEAAFDVWTQNLADLTILRTSGSPPEWPHIPLLRIGRLTTTQKTWHDAYLVTLKAPTYLDTEAKNLA
jgi:hypothetical protein